MSSVERVNPLVLGFVLGLLLTAVIWVPLLIGEQSEPPVLLWIPEPIRGGECLYVAQTLQVLGCERP